MNNREVKLLSGLTKTFEEVVDLHQRYVVFETSQKECYVGFCTEVNLLTNKTHFSTVLVNIPELGVVGQNLLFNNLVFIEPLDLKPLQDQVFSEMRAKISERNKTIS